MGIEQIIRNVKKDFNRALSLAAVIPLLVFIYLVVGKLADFNALAGEVGYIVVAAIGVFVMGVVVGRRMLMSVTFKLIDDNQKILSMQQELIEKNRLAAVTETVLALGDQVNNPLLAIGGNLEMLDSEIGLEASEKIHNRLATMRNNFLKIREVTDKMSKLTKSELTVIHGNTRMIDINK